MAPDPERLALNLEIAAILQRPLAKIAEHREFTLGARAHFPTSNAPSSSIAWELELEIGS